MKTQAIVMALVLTAAVMAAQQPPRDTRPPAAVGSGVITGVALTGDPDPRPLRGAHVALEGAALLGGRIVITDATGVFRFSGLPPGRFTLSATKPAYLTANYGAKRPGGPGVPLALADGSALTDLKLMLAKGGVISGRIVDERGRPQRAAEVTAMRYSWFTGERQLSATTSTVTDDRGEYRIFGLLPDEYIVRVNRGNTGSIRMLAPGEIDAALNPQRSSGPVEPRPYATFGFSPVYYPGTAVAAEAAIVPVAVGSEAGGIDFAVKYVPTSQIAGTIVGGAVATGRTQVRLLGGSIARSGITTEATGRPGGPRAFTFSGVGPGHYTVMAWTSATGAAVDGATEWASSEVDVSGQHIDGLELRLRPGFTVSGRVVFEDLGGGPMPPGWQVAVSAVLAPNEASVSGTPVLIGADGGFTIRGITPARYRVRAASQTPLDSSGRSWTLKSATANGADVADVPIDLRSGVDLADVVVTLSAKQTELTGTLQTAAGDPAPAFFVIAYPKNRAFWTSYSRHIKTTRPGTDGKYRLAGLPAGEYYIVALTDVEQGEWLNPGFLESLITASATVTLTDGEKKSLDLKIAR